MTSRKMPLYLDYQSTTPLDDRALERMMPYLTESYGNPHSTTHRYGWEAEAGVEWARARIAGLINADPATITFTSGATEANNLAIKGAAQVYGARRPHMVSVVTEHKCVLEALAAVEAMGLEVTLLSVGKDGLVDLNKLADAITDRTCLVSVMQVNNEIGVIQPIREIAAAAHAKGALFHCDAAQGLGKLALDVAAMEIDLMSLSGHKIYGPKGIGALYKRPDVRLVPQMDGGGQEGGLRSGTLSPALCVGFGAAAELCGDEIPSEQERLRKLWRRLTTGLARKHQAIRINGDPEQRWPGNLNITLPGLDGDLLVSNLRGLAVSSGAACASAVEGPSYVLQALGCSDADAKSSLRIGLGRFTSEADVDFAIEQLDETITRMGGLKP